VVVISLVWLVACLGGGSGLCVLVRAGTARLGQAKAITTATASATVFTAIPTVSSIAYILTGTGGGGAGRRRGERAIKMRFVWIKAAATVAAAMAAAMAVAVAVAAVVVVAAAAAAIRYQHINTRRTGDRQMSLGWRRRSIVPPWSPPVPRGTARHRSL
jgi:hypothetical protein